MTAVQSNIGSNAEIDEALVLLFLVLYFKGLMQADIRN